MPSFILNNLLAPDPPGNPQSGSGGQGIFPSPAQAGLPPPILDNLPIIDHVNIDVMNASIYWSTKEGTPSAIGFEKLGTWQPFVFMPPGSRTIYNRGGGILGFQFYAANPNTVISGAGGTQARVTVEAVQ